VAVAAVTVVLTGDGVAGAIMEERVPVISTGGRSMLRLVPGLEYLYDYRSITHVHEADTLSTVARLAVVPFAGGDSSPQVCARRPQCTFDCVWLPRTVCAWRLACRHACRCTCLHAFSAKLPGS